MAIVLCFWEEEIIKQSYNNYNVYGLKQLWDTDHSYGNKQLERDSCMECWASLNSFLLIKTRIQINVYGPKQLWDTDHIYGNKQLERDRCMECWGALKKILLINTRI